MQDILDVLKVQRHDFMNHLQVISGLLQLGKYDGAGEYIKKVAEELKRASLISKMSSPEIALTVITAGLAAQKRGITINHVIKTGLEKGLDNGLAIAEILREMLEAAIHQTDFSPSAVGEIELLICERDREYQFQISFRNREYADSLATASSAVFWEDAAAKVKGQVKTGVLGDGVTVFSLLIPVPVSESIKKTGA